MSTFLPSEVHCEEKAALSGIQPCEEKAALSRNQPCEEKAALSRNQPSEVWLVPQCGELVKSKLHCPMTSPVKIKLP